MPRDWVQWLAAIVGALTVVAVVAILVADGAGREATPPMPTVTLHEDEAYQAPTGWIVPATLTNEGSTAAEALELVATASVGGTEEESAVTVDYAPPGSEVELAFGFTAIPDAEISVRVVGFRIP